MKREILPQLLLTLRAAIESGSRDAIDQAVERFFSYERQSGERNVLLSHLKSELFLLKAQSRLERGDVDEAFAHVVLALRLSPYSQSAIVSYERLVDLRRTEVARTVILIISCGKYQRKARALGELIHDMPGVDYRIVMGKEAGVTPVGKLIKVQASDHYEALPHKVRDAFLYVFQTFGAGSSVIKMDDDLAIRDVHELARNVHALVERGCDYAGFPEGGPLHDRTWHRGKCSSAAMNNAIYGKRFYGRWATGPLYFLSAQALRLFCLACVRFPDEISGELFEDKFVGDVLRREGIELTELDPEALGVAADNIYRKDDNRLP